jgi:hypothetical protein
MKNIVIFSIVIRVVKKLPVFKPSNKLLLLWDVLLCILILIEMFAMTIRLFFCETWMTHDFQGSLLFWMLSAMLILDIFVHLNTGIYRNGVATYERILITKTYIKSGLILFDMISLFAFFIPLEYLIIEEGFHYVSSALLTSPRNIIKLLFFLKLKNVNRMFELLEHLFYSDEYYEAVLALIKLISQIMLISHILACLWNLSGLCGRLQGNSNWIDEKFGATQRQFFWNKHYLYSWYWSLTTMITVGYGDIYAQNDFEVLISAVSMLLGCGFFAYAINSIGYIVEKFDLKKKNLR